MRLRYTLPALADLNAVLDYIAVHSQQGARHVQRRIRAITELLLQHPGIGRRTGDPAVLNGTLEDAFRRRYPDFRPAQGEQVMAKAA